MKNLLPVLVLLPILAGILFLFFRSRIAKYSAFFISLVEVIMTIRVFIGYRTGIAEQVHIAIPWIREWGIDFGLSLDGINVLLVLLTGLAVPLIVLAGWEKHYHNYGLMDGMVLIMQGSLMGVFLSYNAFVYYVFWEMTLIPAYIILLIWGGERRMHVTLKFFLYTLTGSLFMLIALISLYLTTPGSHSFSLEAFQSLSLNATHQRWLFLAFMAAFLIKTPVFPFHSWQPETYTEAPSAGTMLLGGLMSKMGLFSILRWVFPLLPLAVKQFAPYVMWLAVVSTIYAAVIALQQKNVKMLFAYSSMAHLSLIVAALFTLRSLAIQGALLMMLSHGLLIIGLFFVADIFKVRADSQWIPDLGGIRTKAPVFAAGFLIVLLTSVAFPLTSGFPGEVLMLTALVKANIWLAIGAGLSMILGVVYMLAAYKKSMLGEPGLQPFADLNVRERFLFILLSVMIFSIGIFPSLFLQATQNSASWLINLLMTR
jgi:NADH-quinone oxidoreductase subunit M